MEVRSVSAFKTLNVSLSTAATGLSSMVDLEGYSFFAINMTTAWDTANITLQACPTGDGTFQDVYDDNGTEVTITAAASRIITVNTNLYNLAPLRFIKLRSGTTATPVAQSTSRTLTLVLK